MNSTRRLRALLPALLVVSFAGTSARAASTTEAVPSPKAWTKTVVERGRDLATRKVQAGTPAEEKWRNEAKALIDDTLDWPELTRQALGRQWEKLTPAQQKEFSSMLREMIEASYQSKLKLVTSGSAKKPEQVQIDWQEEKVEGNDALLGAKVKTEKNVATLEFKLKWRDGRWRVWDVGIDDVSTVRTYRTQFAKIIGKDGFDALMNRIRAKTADIRAGRAEISP